MNQFEKDFEAKFPVIRQRIGAFLAFQYPPMRCVGTRGSMPVFVQTGRALYDVGGWIPHKKICEHQKMDFDTYNEFPSLAVHTAIELKETSKAHPSMRIVGADGSGSGIQSHQLEALASVHRDGGIARLLWNNGGVYGVLDGDQLAHAWFTYGTSVQAEKMRKTFAKGSRSIPWPLFRKVDFVEAPESIILGPVQEPTLAESLKRKRKKAAKVIDAAYAPIVDD